MSLKKCGLKRVTWDGDKYSICMVLPMFGEKFQIFNSVCEGTGIYTVHNIKKFTFNSTWTEEDT